ncbi:MAG TPA: hypothetical protein VHM16_01265 [Rubrobacteraceae bacterium]|nr:hypothetical protein [Rubrobacteraceae bacterium]
MTKTIQIRNIPDESHRTLEARTTKSGVTLSDYLLSKIEQVGKKPTMKEWLEKSSQDEPVELDEPLEATIRRMHDAVEVHEQ